MPTKRLFRARRGGFSPHRRGTLRQADMLLKVGTSSSTSRSAQPTGSLLSKGGLKGSRPAGRAWRCSLLRLRRTAFSRGKVPSAPAMAGRCAFLCFASRSCLPSRRSLGFAHACARPGREPETGSPPWGRPGPDPNVTYHPQSGPSLALKLAFKQARNLAGSLALSVAISLALSPGPAPTRIPSRPCCAAAAPGLLRPVGNHHPHTPFVRQQHAQRSFRPPHPACHGTRLRKSSKRYLALPRNCRRRPPPHESTPIEGSRERGGA